jgi:hypothetical protein
VKSVDVEREKGAVNKNIRLCLPFKGEGRTKKGVDMVLDVMLDERWKTGWSPVPTRAFPRVQRSALLGAKCVFDYLGTLCGAGTSGWRDREGWKKEEKEERREIRKRRKVRGKKERKKGDDNGLWRDANQIAMVSEDGAYARLQANYKGH